MEVMGAAEVMVLYQDIGAIDLVPPGASQECIVFSQQFSVLLRDVGPCGALSFRRRQRCLRTPNASQSEVDAAEGLESYLRLIREERVANPYKILLPSNGSTAGIADGMEFSVSPKFERLLEMLETSKRRSGDLRCVIFVGDRCSVTALCCVFSALSRRSPERFGFLRPGFVMNAMDENHEDVGRTLGDFR